MRFSAGLLALVLAMACGLTILLSLLDWLFTREPLTGGDIATDLVEMLVLSGAMVASVFIVGRLRDLEAQTNDLHAEVSAAANAGREWRRQSEHLLRGLSEAVTAQFGDWGLIDAESDIAAMILKGASLREIAQVRRTSEATIRQQAQSIYQKSGLSNRSQLAAYFLEDLFDVAAAATRFRKFRHLRTSITQSGFLRARPLHQTTGSNT
jgi:DNA-binding CsgD family transcriptional regulator